MSELFDYAESRKARDAGMKKVTDNGQPWNERALTSLTRFKGAEATGEDIRRHVSAEIGEPHHPNGWGALVRSAIKKRWLIHTGIYRPMRAKRSHARRTPVYKVRVTSPEIQAGYEAMEKYRRMCHPHHPEITKLTT